MPKSYREHDELLDLILRALIDQFRLRIDYAGVAGEGKVHRFEPYTLVAYRGGLYLLGHSDVYEQVVYLAIERVRSAEEIKGADGKPEHFDYPKGYHPSRHTDGVFGLIEGPRTDVELLLRGDSEARLRGRIVHRTQKFV